MGILRHRKAMPAYILYSRACMKQMSPLHIEDALASSMGFRETNGSARTRNWPSPGPCGEADPSCINLEQCLGVFLCFESPQGCTGQLASLCNSYGAPWKGAISQRVQTPPGQLSFQPEAIGAGDGGNDMA